MLTCICCFSRWCWLIPLRSRDAQSIATGLLTKVMLGDFLEYHLAITGLIVVAIVFLAPDGLLGLAEKAWRRVRGGSGGGGADPR